ncbi:MFS transporter [Amycolatopsis sp. WAC 01376]|uniref:DHA2 family efflux MFS transporter permease subunit n=1 Tax=Amycolatopsis sp. WAC 01376 TaxID=2203195 RepID=UPI000F7AAACF|nr:DHA2 family efflux MFS transporter permease subunit [Amycolatopsis sp. WAC 01376]RSM55223.1 MFS transporter [Amycolatopsis sp. WAC 01376]
MRGDLTRTGARSDPWLALGVLCLANFLILLDTTIVNTAAPVMMRALEAGIDEILWIFNGYLLTFAALLIVFGRLGDLVGPRTVFIAGLAGFTVASVLCGLSTSPGMLIVFRILQGVGAAALVPQALVLISAIFPARRRGAAFGIFTAVAGLASVSGPTLGGLLVTEFGWQSVFYLNLPIGLIAIVATLRLVPAPRTARSHRFDPVGVLLATTGLTALVFGLIEGERHDWGTVAGPVSIPAIFAASVVLLVTFVLWERRRAEPLVPLTLFRDRNFGIATTITLITSFALYGLLLVFVLETQTLLGMSPVESGLSALPWTLALSAVAPVAGRLTDRIGGKPLLVSGLALFALGVLGVGLLPDSSSTAAVFVLPLIAVGVGQGLTLAPATTEAMRDITPGDSGAASGILNTARQVGGALGAAVAGAILQNRATGELGQHAFLSAARTALAVLAGVLVAGAALATLMKPKRH